MEHPLKSIDTGLDARPVIGDTPAQQHRIVDGQNLANLVERDLEIPKAGDRPADIDLGSPVASIAREPVDLRGPEQVQLVVVAQCADRDPGQPAEPANREEVVVHATHRGPSGRSRVKP